jgi:hypothetical protein
LNIEEIRTSEMSVYNKPIRPISRKTAFFIVTAVRNSNLVMFWIDSIISTPEHYITPHAATDLILI